MKYIISWSGEFHLQPIIWIKNLLRFLSKPDIPLWKFAKWTRLPTVRCFVTIISNATAPAGFALPQWRLFGNNRSARTRKYKTIEGKNPTVRFNSERESQGEIDFSTRYRGLSTQINLIACQAPTFKQTNICNFGLKNLKNILVTPFIVFITSETPLNSSFVNTNNIARSSEFPIHTFDVKEAWGTIEWWSRSFPGGGGYIGHWLGFNDCQSEPRSDWLDQL